MLFDDKTKGIAQAYMSMLGESHFKVGDKVKCKASGMTGTVTKLDKPETGKYYTVKQDSGKEMKYAPDELSKLNEAMDPVNKKELKGKHSERKDKDIDNDGDVDSSDEYLHNRRKAISKSMKESEIEIEIKNNGKKKDEDEEDDEDEDEDEMVVDTKPSNGKKKEKEQVDEISKQTLGSYVKKAATDLGTNTGLAKDFRNKAKSVRSASKKNANARLADTFYDMAKKRKAGVNKAVDRLTKESYQWNWEAIAEAPEEELDAMIEQMNDAELESFISELESIEEGNNWYQGSTNSKAPTMKDPLAGKHGRSDDLETLDPRAEADRAFANAHRQNTEIKDYPGKDKPMTNAKPQAPVRPGEKRNSEPMKTLSDIRKR